MRRMLEHLNQLSLRLLRDEEGAILAVSVLTFLFLFLSAFSVFAVGETVRQRIEIQNAADAAAYSAAVLQADTLSRIATLNRAMAWSYVMLGRMEMDYIVDIWLDQALLLWEIDKTIAEGINMPSTCNFGDWYAGQSRYINKEALKLNGHRWESANTIRMERAAAAAQQKSWNSLIVPITTLRQAIGRMNRAEEELLNQMPGRIENRVRAVLRKNLKDTFNDRLIGSADYAYALLQSESPLSAYTEIIPKSEENRFLNFTEVWDNPRDAFGKGTDDWWVLEPSGTGIQRRYRQRGNRLKAEWDWKGTLWEVIEGVCTQIFSLSGSGSLQAGTVVSGSYFAETELCQPRKLKRAFFGKDGTIVVGVARRVNNPLFFIYGDKGGEGIYRGLTVNDNQRFMWTAAAARAGYNKNWKGQSRGEYAPTWWNIDENNLMNTDWDAVMLPLFRAWSPAPRGSFSGGGTAGAILSEVSGAWKPLYGGGGAPGNQSAPPGMTGGAPAWGALNGWTLH